MSETAKRALSSLVEQVRDLWFLAALLVAIGLGVARLNLRLDALGEHYHVEHDGPPTSGPRVPLSALGAATVATPAPVLAAGPSSWLPEPGWPEPIDP